MQNFKKTVKAKTLIQYREKDMLLDTFVSGWIPAYQLYNKIDKSVWYREEYQIGDNLYRPLTPESSYIQSGSLLFPSATSSYDDIHALIDQIRSYVYKYCDISPLFASIVPYYVLMTYIYDTFYEIPYLRVIGDYGSWKSRFLRVVGSICYSPIIVNGGASVASIFRMIEMAKWTLVLDEADFQFSDTTNEIIKLLNNGFAKWNPILRADGENFEPKAYDVFCPKIIGGRMEFRDKATESRCIVEVMRRTNRQDIPMNLSEEFAQESKDLMNKLYQFRYDFHGKIPIQEERIAWLEWRLNQILNPILSIIKSIGNEKDYKDIIEYFLDRQKEIKEDRKFSIEGMIFALIQDSTSKGINPLPYSHILVGLKEEDTSSNMNPRKLGSLLKQYDIRTIRRSNGFAIPTDINREKLEAIYKSFGFEKFEKMDIATIREVFD